MPAIFPQGDAVRTIKAILKLGLTDEGWIITGDTDDPSSVAKDGPFGSIYLRSGTSEIYRKLDAGSSTNWELFGNLIGSASSTDEAIVRFDGTTGKNVQNSSVTISDADVISGATQLNVDNLRLDGNTLSSTDTDGNINLSPDGTGEVQATKALILNADATQNLEAVTKQQLDAVESKIINLEWQNSVIDKDLTAPPGSPATGDRYLIGLDTGASSATGAWATHDGETTEWNGSTWTFVTPTVGMFVAADDETNLIYLFGSTTWTSKEFEATTASGFLSLSTRDVQFTNLNSANVVIGNGSNVATSVNTGSVGDIAADSTTGLTIKAGAILNADVNTSAAIALTKLAASTIDRALITDGSGVIAPSSTTSTQISYLNTTTSDVQIQIDSKQDDVITTAGDLIVGNGSGIAARLAIGTANHVPASAGTSIVWGLLANSNIDASAAIVMSKLETLTIDRAIASSATGVLSVATTTRAELNFVSGVTSAIQTQLDSKQPELTQASGSGAQSPAANSLLLAESGTATTTVTLPSPAAQAIVVIKDKDGNAGINNITINESGGGDTIDGAASLVIGSDWGSTTLVSDGTDWFIL